MGLYDRTAPPTHDTSEAQLDQFNRTLRSLPWYQTFFAQRGLNPNRVQLSDQQRRDLAGVAAQNGVPVSARMTFDKAGNLNQQGGFAGQPTWLKGVEVAAPIAVGGYFAAPAIGSALGIGGGASAAAGAPAALSSDILGSSAAAAGNAAWAGTLPAVAKTGFSFGKALTNLAPNLINAGTQLYGAHQQTSANDRAAALQQQTAREALAYTERRDAQARQDALDAQEKNYGLYREGQARLDPYRQFGLRSLAQIGRPISGVGTLATRMG